MEMFAIGSMIPHTKSVIHQKQIYYKIVKITLRIVDSKKIISIFVFQFEYHVTCAVCSRTGEKELQIIKKFTQVCILVCT